MDKIMMEGKSRCIIVASGTCETSLLKFIKPDDYVIAADGGYKYLKDADIRPDIIIGDFDSLSKEDLEMIRMQAKCTFIQLPCEKDDTDTLYCIKHAIEKGYGEIHLFGVIGDRPDHSYANIQCLSFMKDKGVSGVIHDTEYDILMLQNESITLDKEYGDEMSIFSFSGKCDNVSLKGFKYPLTDETLTSSFPVGISNVITQDEAKITVGNGKAIVFIKRRFSY